MTKQDTKAQRDTDPGAGPSTQTRVLLAVGLFVALVAGLTATFGLPGLAMSALATVPLIYATLILITVGK